MPGGDWQSGDGLRNAPLSTGRAGGRSGPAGRIRRRGQAPRAPAGRARQPDGARRDRRRESLLRAADRGEVVVAPVGAGCVDADQCAVRHRSRGQGCPGARLVRRGYCILEIEMAACAPEARALGRIRSGRVAGTNRNEEAVSADDCSGFGRAACAPWVTAVPGCPDSALQRGGCAPAYRSAGLRDPA